jgi:hypothetical protein
MITTMNEDAFGRRPQYLRDFDEEDRDSVSRLGGVESDTARPQDVGRIASGAVLGNFGSTPDYESLRSGHGHLIPVLGGHVVLRTLPGLKG